MLKSIILIDIEWFVFENDLRCTVSVVIFCLYHVSRQYHPFSYWIADNVISIHFPFADIFSRSSPTNSVPGSFTRKSPTTVVCFRCGKGKLWPKSNVLNSIFIHSLSLTFSELRVLVSYAYPDRGGCVLCSRGQRHPNGYCVQLELSLIFQPVSLSFNTTSTPFSDFESRDSCSSCQWCCCLCCFLHFYYCHYHYWSLSAPISLSSNSFSFWLCLLLSPEWIDNVT